LLLILNTTIGYTKTFSDLEKEIESVEKDEALIILSHYENDLLEWNQEDQGRYYTLKGLNLENSNLELAEQSYNKSIELLEDLDFISEYLIHALIERSYVYYLKSNDTEAYCPDRLKALELARKTNDYKEALARALVQYSFCFDGKQDQFPVALKLLEEAMQIKEDFGAESTNSDSIDSALIYNSTAILYRSNNIYDKSYDYFSKAYQGWKLQNKTQNMFNMQHSLINICLRMGDINLAKEHEKILFKLTQENPGFSDFLFFYHFNAGMISFEEKDFVIAVEHFDEMFKLKETTNEKYYVRLGLANLAISNFRLNNVELANIQAIDFITISKGFNTLKLSGLMMKMIIDYSENKNRQAITSMWKYIDIIEKNRQKFILNSSKAQSLVFDTNINEFENTINNLLLASEKRKNEIAILSITIIAVFSLAVLLFTFSLWRSKKKFVQLAQIDFLTKIANRRHVFEAGQLLVDHSMKTGDSLSLFIFDIDDFKFVNDKYGHDIGDKVLIKLTNTCNELLPDNSIFGRFGGEEFLYLIPNLIPSEAFSMAEQVRIKVSQIEFIENNESFSITISTGICTSNKNAHMDDFVKQADLALYGSKNNGKNTVTVYKGE